MGTSTLEGAGARACWFVGAAYGGTDDQLPRFLEEGIWQNGWTDRYLEDVRSMQPGDRIAVKAAYTRKRDLPFDNHGNTVSVMAIKAIGTITHNPGDGRTVKVDWTKLEKPREWYFYTYRGTVWRVLPGDWAADGLISFTFENKPQDLKKFRNHPFWRERFGDRAEAERRFKWTRFYEAMADKLLLYRNKREELLDAVYDIGTRVGEFTYLHDEFQDGTTGPLKDICPFTIMGTFNRTLTDANRKAIAAEWAKKLSIDEDIPESFEAIPVLNNQKSCFFSFETRRQPDDIDALWDLFVAALKFAESDEAEDQSAFTAAYDNAAERHGVGWNLTMGLYWIRPWNYPTLEGRSQVYIKKKLRIPIEMNGPKGRCNANDYLRLLALLERRFQEDTYSVHSFPELSYAAWLYTGEPTQPTPTDPPDTKPGKKNGDDGPDGPTAPIVAYSLEHILGEGCFLEKEHLQEILERFRAKKNLILQGPPGTGKTWLAKRLGFALMGQKDDSRLRAVQFHPNLSYEDFVRGWRPEGDGKLSLVDGPLLEMVKAASQEPSARFVMVIEEINRGNPAQIFGETLTLLEDDKRNPDEALELCYRREEGERVFIPDNLYVIGTMNVADRSLALVDFALRRRFAFIDLEPVLGKKWHDWVQKEFELDSNSLWEIEKRILELNDEISADVSLGRQFRVGHSYVTPAKGARIKDVREWFRQVVATEIGPLLDEYWFDALDTAQKARKRLIEGI